MLRGSAASASSSDDEDADAVCGNLGVAGSAFLVATVMVTGGVDAADAFGGCGFALTIWLLPAESTSGRAAAARRQLTSTSKSNVRPCNFTIRRKTDHSI
eukprot:SAG22_NODE_746_length_7496_cov_5.066513_6_plen_100_part_00